MTRITDCIRFWDVEGEGPTLAAALEAIAATCERDAARLEVDASALREAAARFRAMRALCDAPVIDAEFPEADEADEG